MEYKKENNVHLCFETRSKEEHVHFSLQFTHTSQQGSGSFSYRVFHK